MKSSLLILPFFSLSILFISCGSDDEPADINEDPITEANVRAVFNFLPPAGYESTFYQKNLPSNVQAGYNNAALDQNVSVQASENLTGEVIEVTDQLIENAFALSLDEIMSSTVNGTEVYEAMQSNSYRAVMFRGQYQFDVAIQNDPELSVAMTEAALFVDLMTEAMTTF